MTYERSKELLLSMAVVKADIERIESVPHRCNFACKIYLEDIHARIEEILEALAQEVARNALIEESINYGHAHGPK